MAKLLFIQDIQYEYLGPIYISAMLKSAGHDCRVAIGSELANFEAAIEDYRPDMVGFSIMSSSAAWAAKIGLQIKNKYDLPTIFGGVHPTFYPEYIKNQGVDMLIRGEGEEAALDIMNCLSQRKDFGGISNLIYKKDGRIIENEIGSLQPDLDIYPFADRKLYQPEFRRHNMDFSVRHVITSRGCPFDCAFCQAPALRHIYKGKYLRMRKADKVLEELRLLKDTTDTGSIYFVDDTFGLDFNWIKDFLPLYAERIGLEFSCMVRADVLRKNKDYAKLLKSSGCRMVAFGLESGSERIRNGLLKKQVRNEDIAAAASLLHDVGIKFRAYNMLGLPGETLDEALETMQLNIDIKADYPWCSIYLPLKDTALANRALAEGFLDKDYFNSNDKRSFFSGSSPLQSKDIKEICNLQRFFQTAVLWPKSFPLIKRLIKLPPNPLFNLWFGFIFYLVYTKSEGRNWWRTFLFAVKSYRSTTKE